jgi:predicted nucleic acid-binding protein
MIVVDASVALKWVIEEPGRAEAEALAAEADLAAPDLLLMEVANTLWMHVRRRLLSAQAAEESYRLFSRVPIALTPIPDLINDARRIALTLDLTVYDAAYVALARRQGAQLATADKKMGRRALDSGFVRDVVFIGVSPD